MSRDRLYNEDSGAGQAMPMAGFDPYPNQTVHTSGNIVPLGGGSPDSLKRRIADAEQSACAARPNPRLLIEQRIEYHNRMSNQLWALLRALPQEMSRSAEEALAALVTEARPRY